MSSITNFTSAGLSRPSTTAGRIAAFVRRDLVRQLRIFESVFFIVALPTALFLMFTLPMDAANIDAGKANVSAYVMVSLSVYGAAVATTAITGTAAVERELGWGRQLSLTALTGADYIAGKTLVAAFMAVLPIAAIFGAGALTGAEFSEAWMWPASALLALVVALPFALYGLSMAFFFRSEAAVGAATGGLVVFGFLGNLFQPLSGALMEFARFTPMYGPGMLSRWPMMEGTLISVEGEVTTDPLWMPVSATLVWTGIFAALCLLANRRRTSRS